MNLEPLRVVKDIAKNRPELAALMMVVGMFLTFIGVFFGKGIEALDHNTQALLRLSVAIEEAVKK